MMNYLSIFVAYLVVLSIHVGIAMGQIEVDIKTDTKPSTIIPSPSDDDQLALPFFIRLHLIRHGETHANVQNIVLGQGDSPLTENGVNVARLAAESDLINGSKLKYWRHYCSDLERAHRTAKIVLGIEKDDDDNSNEEASDINLIVDSRLRELAKGPREGYLKKYTHEEAIELRRLEAGVTDNNISIPKLESLDDAYSRVVDWVDSIIEEASEDYENTCDDNDDVEPKVYDVFALSHSALIRTIIHKMVDHELPTDYKKTKEGSLRIPNLSRTIIDIQPYKSKRWTPSLNRLTDVSHLNDAAKSGPPYLYLSGDHV